MTHKAECIVMSLLILEDNGILHVSIRLVSSPTHGHTIKWSKVFVLNNILNMS